MQRVPLRRRLFVVTGQLQISDGRVVAVRDGLTMGRVAGCDIVIDDTKASRRHARIVVMDGVVEVEDLGSSNGTMLNGKPVQRRVVRAQRRRALKRRVAPPPRAQVRPCAVVLGCRGRRSRRIATATAAPQPPRTRPTRRKGRRDGRR